MLRSSDPRRARRGFALTDVVAALALLSVGALALVAASAAAIRTIGAATSQDAATALASDRLEQMTTGACAALRDGGAVDSARGVAERWTVAGARGVRLVTDSVEYTDRDGRHAIVLRRLVLC